MEKIAVEVEGFPTIPAVFLGGIRKYLYEHEKENRTPVLNSMGFAVTTLDEGMKSLTRVERTERDGEVEFYLNGKEIDRARGSDIISLARDMMRKAGAKGGLRIDSRNFLIKSGSSDSGVAALVTAIDHLYGMNLSMDEKIEFGKRGSESVQRSLLGGLSETNVDDPTNVKGIAVADAERLKDMRIFQVPFGAPGEGPEGHSNWDPVFAKRITADEIHEAIVRHEKYPDRMRETPQRVMQVKAHAKSGNLPLAFETILKDVENAHNMLEGMGLVVRKGPMGELWKGIKDFARGEGIHAVPTAGGGNQISILTTREHAKKVRDYLARGKFHYRECKIAPGARVVRVEHRRPT